jgi:hypothetical protein
MSLPPAAIDFGTFINGILADPVAYLLYTLANRFEQLEEERVMSSGNLILDFEARPGENTDALLIRWDMCMEEVRSVGAAIENLHTLCTILFRACRLSHDQILRFFEPSDGRMPTTQTQYDAMVIKLRQMGHILEHTPGNAVEGLRAGRRQQQAYLTDATVEDAAMLFGQTWSQDNATPRQSGLGASWYGESTTGQYSSDNDTTPSLPTLVTDT